MDTIIAESEVAKATFYKHVPRKDDLVLAYLDRVDEVWLGQLRAAARAVGEEPRDQLIGVFDALRSACRRDGYHGCAFINTAAESHAGSDVHGRTIEHKRLVLAWVTDLARRAGATKPEQLARQLTLLLDGGLAAGVLDADPDAPVQAKAAAITLVSNAVGPCADMPGRGLRADRCGLPAGGPGPRSVGASAAALVRLQRPGCRAPTGPLNAGDSSPPQR